MADVLEYRARMELQEPAPGERVLRGVLFRYGDRANLGGFTEEIEPGAITVAPDARMNIQHRRELLLSRRGAGLEFTDTPTMLAVKASLPETRLANDVLESVRAGLHRGLSGEFVIREREWRGRHRIVKRAELRSVAVVDNPAYPDSALEKRMLEDFNFTHNCTGRDLRAGPRRRW